MYIYIHPFRSPLHIISTRRDATQNGDGSDGGGGGVAGGEVRTGPDSAATVPPVASILRGSVALSLTVTTHS